MSARRNQESSRRRESAAGPAAPALYPAFLKLDGRSCLVVGGGAVAFQKVQELLKCGARVRTVSPQWGAEFASLAGHASFEALTRGYEPRDLDGATLVVAATDDRAVQERVAGEAQERGILCNVADVPELCDFYLPASARRGALTVSVSTQGVSPLLAVALRDRIAAGLGEHFPDVLERLGRARTLVRAKHPEDPEARKRALVRLLSPRAVDQILEGRLDDFEAHWRSWTSSLSE